MPKRTVGPKRHVETFRKYLSERRKSGPRRMREGDRSGLTVLRDLQKDVIMQVIASYGLFILEFSYEGAD